jgi:pSer/pThr/pTyr-binding forkhead associated (FHA) protein
MKKVTLQIETRSESRSIELEDEISIGRTDSADVVLDDIGLSRVNTTFFRDGEMVLVVDEKSLNGTFLNGEKLGSKPVRVLGGDKIKLGVETTISVQIEGEKPVAATDETSNPVSEAPTPAPKQDLQTQIQTPKSNGPPVIIMVAVASVFLIVFLAIAAVVIVRFYNPSKGGKTGNVAVVQSSKKIPRRVIDPLGGGDAEDIDDLMTFWDVQEEELNTNDVAAITSTSSVAKINLDVSLDFFKKQMDRSKAQRNAPTGNDPPGQIIPPQLRNGIAAQTAKIQQMRANGYVIPLDFADLAEKRIAGKLIELPMATDDYVLDVGGSSDGLPFNNFSFNTSPRSQPLASGTAKFNILSQLANNFDGQKYSLDNPTDRRQMKIRMLRMFHPSAKPVLEKLAKDYRTKFGYPLRVTSLSRSMEYQISLNAGNPNSYVVRGASSLPPHTSGCTFDLSRKFMTAEEQNFLMLELATMETAGMVDALREGNVNACFHVFILGACDI